MFLKPCTTILFSKYRLEFMLVFDYINRVFIDFIRTIFFFTLFKLLLTKNELFNVFSIYYYINYRQDALCFFLNQRFFTNRSTRLRSVYIIRNPQYIIINDNNLRIYFLLSFSEYNTHTHVSSFAVEHNIKSSLYYIYVKNNLQIV